MEDMKIGILTAMGSERARIEALLEDRRELVPEGAAAVCPSSGPPSSAGSPRTSRVFQVGRIGRNEVALSETGIGKVNAAVGALELIRAFRPDCLVSTGVAGGLDASLHVMDVVVGAEVVYHDADCGPGNEPGQIQGLPARYAADPALLARALAIHTEGVAVRGGLIASGDQFVSSKGQLAAIKKRFPEALAVDMESGALAQVCHLCQVPFLSFRILSDTPGVDGHDRQYKDFWGEMANRSFSVTRHFLAALGA